MKAMTALLRREFLEHRGAFLYAPAVLIAALLVLITAGIIFGDTPSIGAHNRDMTPLVLLQIAFGGVGAMWSAYLIVALYFYYADAFSADQRNNSMLFWKSMPQSDLTILTSKAIAGLTILPALILGFALINMVLVYLLSFPLAARLPFIPIANPIDMLAALFGMGIGVAVFLVLSVIWYAPFLALVAGLSVLVKRWAIPAAILLIGAVVITETVLTFGRTVAHPIREYIAYRADGFAGDIDPMPIITKGGYMAPFDLIGTMLSNVDWLQMALGVAIAVAVVYGSSEYRRRRLDS
ncbi:MAG: hypothetical protein KKH72_05875 [Alphaproteobacteria bacterium]|nr:hypothetical protein [Alphaproteobacteria bacterium]